MATGNQRNWNNLKSYQLGLEFVFHKKPCFNCGDFSHLANDCRKKVQRETTRSQNHPYKSSSHRSGGHRPHGAPMRPPLRSFVHRPHGGSMRPSHRSAGHRPHGPSMNPRIPTMNGARPYKSLFIQSPSYETRPFLKSIAVKTPYRAPWVPTINRVGYNAVPPPTADLYLSPKKDLSWTGLLEFVDDTVNDYSRPSPIVASTLAEVKTQYRASWVPNVNRNNPPVNRKFFTGRRNFPTTNRKFSTARRKFPTGSTKIHTAGTKSSTADMGMKGKAVKPSACWF
nr:hypothetical protein [Tanacetum cinerariifolium]